MPHVLAIDQGTTSSRAIVFDPSGSPVAVAQREFTQHLPRDGWVEHDADEIWATQSATIAEAMSRADLRRGDVAAVGITNQRETTVVWDRATGRPIHHAIVWQDRRTAAMIDRIKRAGHEATITAKTGLIPDAYFSASKIAWLLDHVPGARDRAERGDLAFGTVDSWLIWRLTDGRVHATDATNASRTMLFDIHRGQWDDDLLALWNVPRSMLPDVRSCSEVYADVSADGPLVGVPIAGVAGDQQAATFGQLCVDRGMTKTTYGTGCFMLMSTADEPVASRNRLLTTVASMIDGKLAYALEGAVFIGGAVVQWLRDGLKLIRSADEADTLAATVPDNGGVYLVPAFVGLGAPHWDPYARGVMCGLTRGATAGHLARAALESIAFQVADLLDAMTADSGSSVPVMRVDGGAARSDLLMQTQADLSRVAVERPVVTETTALGAAYLAGLAVGLWPSAAALGEHRAVERTFEPMMSADRAASMRATWTKAVGRAGGWVEAD